MSKIRINELARELEVKPSVILDLLPELGVTDKKTHSSSLEDDVVVNLRRRVAGMGAEEQAASHEAAPRQEPARQSAIAVEEPAPVAKSAPAPVAPEPAKPTASAPAEKSEAPAPVRPAFPLRPPLATGQPGGPNAPANRGAVIPSRSGPPPPRPGQILSGPRQPMADAARPTPAASAPIVAPPPTAPATPSAPAPPVMITTPGTPRPGTAVPPGPRLDLLRDPRHRLRKRWEQAAPHCVLRPSRI
jgi:translation initiation factor IF-2